MAESSILQYKKPGFPVEEITEKEYSTRIEYVGPQEDLESASAGLGEPWGSYPGVIATANIMPIEGSAYATLYVVVTKKTDLASDSTTGEKERETYEIEWVAINRPLAEHPKFYDQLSDQSLIDIDFWRNGEDPELKKEWKYRKEIIDGSLYTFELDDLSKLYAKGLLLNQNEWEDFSPVVRKTSFYVNGPPPSSEAGQKQDPIGIPNVPTGYEWRKSADRSLNAEGQNRWQKIEEWTGAKKVMSDKDEIFWTVE